VVLDVSYDSARVFRGRLWDHGKFLFALVWACFSSSGRSVSGLMVYDERC
jgi:hypothetical protein